MKMTIFLLLIIFLGCDNHTETENNLNELINYYQKDVDFGRKPVIIIPLYGCSTCVDLSLMYMQKKLESGQIVFILSSLYKKDFSIKLGEIKVSKYIIYDTINNAAALNLIFNTPTAYIKSDSVITLLLQTNEDYMKMEKLTNLSFSE